MKVPIRVLQVRADEVVQVTDTPQRVKVVTEPGVGATAFKFMFSGGGVLYVPMPHEMRSEPDETEVSATAGPMRS